MATLKESKYKIRHSDCKIYNIFEMYILTWVQFLDFCTLIQWFFVKTFLLYYFYKTFFPNDLMFSGLHHKAFYYIFFLLVSIRLKSVKNIQKITKSMKMVSAAKYAKAERELKPARAYGEGAYGR